MKTTELGELKKLRSFKINFVKFYCKFLASLPLKQLNNEKYKTIISS